MASGKIVLSNSVPVGYRFRPTDEEIVSYFLKNKMLGNDHLVQDISEVDVLKYEPCELPKLSVVESGDPEWFFFSACVFKYSNGRRSNRTTRDGYWKVTGRDQNIKARKTKNLIGTKKHLVFYEGRTPNGVRTNWVMHEYHSVDNNPQRRTYVVCRLKKKDDEKVDKSANGECENDNVDSYFQSRTIEGAIPEVWREENGGLPSPLPSQEANSELLRPSAHLNWEDDSEIVEFVNSALINDEEYYNDFIRPPWTGSTHLEGAMLGRDTRATRPLFGDLPPNSSTTNDYSIWSVQPQMRMMKKSRDNMLQSRHLRYEEQENTYRFNEFSGQNTSGESTDDMRRINFIFESNAPLKRVLSKTEYQERHVNPRSDRRILLQRKIGNTAANPIKAEGASKYTSNDHVEEKEIGTRPPSEYFVNVVEGIVLFLVFVREMVLYGEWGM